jgi:hypothetical protein
VHIARRRLQEHALRADEGLFPRGYAGAAGTLDDVDLVLVLVLAEPGEPSSNVKPPLPEEPAAIVENLAAQVANAVRARKSAFHRNVHFLLECCWPDLTFDEQLRRTWISEGVLCSAAQSTARVPRVVETACAERYLAKQPALLPNAFVIALGKKAKRRLRIAGRKPNHAVYAAGLPGGNRKNAKPSWQTAGLAFREYLSLRGKL